MGGYGTGAPSDDGGVHEALVEVPRSRDAEFTVFVRDSGAYLHKTAYLLCGDSHRAEELVQSTFERLYRTWARVRPGTERAYARRILVNLRIDGWRHARRESFPGGDKIPVTPASGHAGRVVLRETNWSVGWRSCRRTSGVSWCCGTSWTCRRRRSRGSSGSRSGR